MSVAEAEQIAAGLAGAGWCWCPQLLPPELVTGLRVDLLLRSHRLRPAAVGRERLHDSGERGDLTLWLEGAGPAQRAFLERLEQLRVELNRRLFLGLFDYQAHYALYPPGAVYRRHLDAFRGASNRVLSTVFYLNEDWAADAGGELVLWNAAGVELARLAPVAGAALFFLSAEFPHAVLAATRPRYSIAGWFHRNPAAFEGMAAPAAGAASLKS
jgi:SM-20-related protein